MSRVLALDLDDTLLRSDRTISSRTLALLRSWEERGNRVVIATGRPPRSIPESLPDVLMGVPWICYNGAEIRQDGCVVYQDLIPAAATRRIVELIQHDAPEMSVGLEIGGVLYMNRQPEQFKLCEIVDLASVADQPSAKFLFLTPDMARLAPVLEKLPTSTRAMLSDRYQLVQVLSATADKARALQHLVTGWGLTMQDVVARGDDVNDVGMVQHSGLGVAVENAVPEVIAVADHVTATNDEDGVALLLADLLQGVR